MSNNYCVYKHTTPSGKVYIGLTSMNPLKRWKNGEGYENCTAFYRAVKKYGWDNIRHEILLSGLDKETACRKEKEYIRAHNSTNPEHGYNLTTGGEHYEFNSAIKARLSASIKKAYAEHPEYRRRISENQRGKKASEESSKKKREAMLRYYESHPEKKTRCGDGIRGKKRSDEFSRQLGERKSKRVICIESQMTYRSIKEASEAENVPRTGITNMLSGRAKTCGGKTFAYAGQGGTDR